MQVCVELAKRRHDCQNDSKSELASAASVSVSAYSACACSSFVYNQVVAGVGPGVLRARLPHGGFMNKEIFQGGLHKLLMQLFCSPKVPVAEHACGDGTRDGVWYGPGGGGG